MPSKCFVSGCRSNYSPNLKVRVFSFPRDEALKALWLKAVQREDKREPSKASKICEQHFESQDIITEATGFDSKTREVIRVPLRKHRLRPNAVPSIFEGLAPRRKRKCVSLSSDLEDSPVKEGSPESTPDTGLKMQNRRSRSTSASDASKELDEESEDSTLSEAVPSPTTDRPFISILKSKGLEEEETVTKKVNEENVTSPRKLTPGKSSPVKRPNSSNKSIPNALPSPYKHFPTVTVCLKEEDRVNVQRELGKSAKRSSLLSISNSEPVKLTTKRRKVEKPAPTVLGRVNDCFCWVCHRENVHLACITCPRAFHQKCCGKYEVLTDWVCSECKRIVAAETEDTRSTVLSQISLDKLHTLLRFCLTKMKQRAGVAFHQPVSLEHYPKYLHYVIHPMDFSLLEKKIKQKAYGCTEAFLADVKWILHNSCVFNGNQHPLSTNAKSIVKTCDNDMQEIEVCPDCFCHSIVRNKYWFSEVCRKPHPLVWAKLKGFPYWPAKVVRIADGNVDARFFGAHDRAWVPIVQCYHLSKEMPTSSKPKKKGNYETALDELNAHVQLLMQKFGVFEYAPYRTVFDPNNTYFMYHSIAIDKISQEEIPFSIPTNIIPSVCNSQEFEKRLSIESNEDDQSKHSNDAETKESISTFQTDSDATKDTKDAQPSNFPDSLTSDKDEIKDKEPEPIVLPELDSAQLSKIELALERIKGYVSVNPDTEKDSQHKESVLPEVLVSPNSDNKLDTSKNVGSFLADLMKRKPLPPTIDLSAIEEDSQKDNTPVLDTAKKNDLFSLKLIETIESCKAKLGLSGASDLLEKSSSTDDESLDDDDEEEEDDEMDKEENDHSDDGEAKTDDQGKNEGANNDETVEGEMSEEEETSDESSSETDDDSNSVSSNTDIETVEDIDDSLQKDAGKGSEGGISAIIENNVENLKLSNVKNTPDLKSDESAQLSTTEKAGSEKGSENVIATENGSPEFSDKNNDISVNSFSDKTPDSSSTTVSPSKSLLNNTSSDTNNHTTPSKGEKEVDSEIQEENSMDVDPSVSENNTCDNSPSKHAEMVDEDIYICPPPRVPTPPLICLDDGSETEPDLSHETDLNASPVMKSLIPPNYLPPAEAQIGPQSSEKYMSHLSQAKLIPTNARKSIKRPVRPPTSEESSDDDEEIGQQQSAKRVPLTGAKRTFNNVRATQSSPLSASPKSSKSSESAFNLLSEEAMENSDNEQNITADASAAKFVSGPSNTLEEKDAEILKLKKKLSCLFSAVQLQHWKHNQEKTELRHNMNQTLLEMRTALEADKKFATEAIVKRLEQEKHTALDEAKRKQWCASCYQESRYACCWNTSYCSLLCQKRNFMEHYSACTQLKSKSIVEMETSNAHSPSLVNDGKESKKLFLLNVVPKPDAKSPLVIQQDPTLHKIALSKVIKPQTPVHLVSSSSTPANHPVKFVLAPVKTVSPSTQSETTIPKTPISIPGEIALEKLRKAFSSPNVSTPEDKSPSNKQEGLTASKEKLSKEKQQEPSLEEIYFPSPPTVNFEGLETALPDEHVHFDLADFSDTDDLEKTDVLSADEDIVFSDSDCSTEMFNLGHGIKVKSKLIHQCLNFGKTAQKYTRCLVNVLFPDEKLLASCSVFGSWNAGGGAQKLTRAGLPHKKVEAIFDAVIKRFPETSRTEVALAINMKCKEARLKVAKTERFSKQSKKPNFENPPTTEGQKQAAEVESLTQKKATIVRNLSSNPDSSQKTTALPLTSASKSVLNRLIKPAPLNIVRCSSNSTVLIRPKIMQQNPNTAPTLTSVRAAPTTVANLFTAKRPPQIPLPKMQKNTSPRPFLSSKPIGSEKNPKADLTKIVFPMDILKKTPVTSSNSLLQRSSGLPYNIMIGSPTSASSQPRPILPVSKPEPASS